MKNKGSSTGLWRGLSAVMACFLALLIGGQSIAQANASFINGQLGLTNYKIVDKAEGEATDSIYYKSEFGSLKELVAAKEALAEEIASEGAVLLKNEGAALPLNTADTVTLWGLNSVNPTLGGKIGSSVSIAADAGQQQYDLVASLNAKGYSLNQTMLDFLLQPTLTETYGRKGGHSLTPSFGKIYENPASYCVGEAPADQYSDELLASADGTVALVVLSRDSSEAADYNPNMTSAAAGKKMPVADSFERPLALSVNEKAVIEMAKAHSSKVVVLINANNPIEIEELKNDAAIGAIVWVSEPGMDGFLGVADVLRGAVNPSGKLPDTFAVRSDSAPSMVNFGVHLYTNHSQSGAADALGADDKGDWYLVESESIYNGYKYYETRYEDAVLGQANAASNAGTDKAAWNYGDEVVYPFGYGLSYTNFEQTLKSVDLTVGGEGKAVVTVKNTGDVAGKSVVELYVQAPYKQGGLEKSAVQLVAFEKTALLEPGASEDVTVTFDPAYFASYDENAVKANGTQGAWVLEDGDYYFAIGNGAHEALNNILAKKNGSEDGLVKTADIEAINADNAIVWNLAATDIETYSKNVENQLQDMDINKLIENAVEYTTRSDWTKGWTPVESLTPTEAMLVGLKDMLYTFSENDNDGNPVVWGESGPYKLVDALRFDESGKCIGVAELNDPFWDELLNQVTLDEAINFVSKAGDDLENLDSIQLSRVYCNDGPLGYTGDQVGGYFVRWTANDKSNPYFTAETDDMGTYRMAVMPTEPMVAATYNKELIVREGELLGEDGLYAKESSIYAPGLNMHRATYCARNHEYYSEDSVLTAYMGNAVCTGLKSKGTMAEPKHFAFNHQEANRSGLSTFMTEQAAREGELRGFQMCMSNNTAQGIMTAFNRAGVAYSGAYRPTLTNIARGEWGYTGWYVTDMINGADYMNWRDMTAAGGGGALTSSAYDTSNIGDMAASKSVIEKDHYFQQQMKDTLKYFVYQIAQSNAMNGISSTTEIVYIRTWVDNALTGGIAAFAVLTALFLVVSITKEFKSKKKN